MYLTALAGDGTVYLLTFAESSQTWGTWSFTSGTLNDETIAAADGDVFIAGRDSGDRIYWYSVTGSSSSPVSGAGIGSTVLAVENGEESGTGLSPTVFSPLKTSIAGDV